MDDHQIQPFPRCPLCKTTIYSVDEVLIPGIQDSNHRSHGEGSLYEAL